MRSRTCLFDAVRCKGSLYTLEKAWSAYKHGISDEAIDHALRNVMRVIEQEYDGQVRQLVIGPYETARLPEIVVVHDDKGARVVHADVLREKFYEYLRTQG